MVKLFVEGGGQTKAQRKESNRGLRKFLQKCGLRGIMPRVVASGYGIDAYDDYCTALNNGEPAVLLVDSEEPVKNHHQTGEPENWQPWQHLSERKNDKLAKPDGASDTDCHLMVECMENWLVADRQALQNYYGSGFKVSKLPAESKPLESISKSEVLTKLKDATRDCKTKKPYDKGRHSFDLLAGIDPHRVMNQSPWAKRFVDLLTQKMNP